MSYNDGFDDDGSGSDQTGPAVWADASVPVPPAMRTFKALIDGLMCDPKTVYIDAHSVTCEGDAVKFYTYRPDRVDGVMVLVAYCTRVLRPYLDVEDVTQILATTSKTMN